ncbi:FAD-dependent oxidoreductase [Thorsellia kenyensis]|uniref:FAD-dependent oxidoreductase n=1 Tax=Thorsellia kenyensis TaxID=1549888 RepID=A0ABV6CAQ8_9GAMM
MFKKIAIILLWLLLIAAFFYFDVSDHLTLDRIQNHYRQWQITLHESPTNYLYYATLFFIIYLVMVSASLPGAAILTLLSGALFGFTTGLLIVSFASSLGATIAFLSSRYLLRNLLQNKFRDSLEKINQGLDKEGWLYLLTLRLIPIFPFFLINIVMGLTKFNSLRFYLISQIGMLPGTMIFVFAGTELSKIKQMEDIFSPPILITLTLLGLFPIVIKKTLSFVKRKKQLKPFTQPNHFDYNLVVIGAGAAGLVSSYIASSVKARVLLIERDKMGGDCLNHGCVPSKSLISSAAYFHAARELGSKGFVQKRIIDLTDEDFVHLFKSITQRIAKIAPKDSIERYTDLGVEVVIGNAQIITPWQINITGRQGGTKTVTTKSIIIATGSEPKMPLIPGIEEVPTLTTDTLWDAFSARTKKPRHILIQGSGPIALELAQSFSHLGIQVTIIARGENILSKEDNDVITIAKESLIKSGVNILFNAEITSLHKSKESILPYYARINQKCDIGRQHKHEIQNETLLNFDVFITAIGRKPRLTEVGLENLGINSLSLTRKSNHGATETAKNDTHVITHKEPNEYLELPFSNIYLAGDCVGGRQFTHLAAHHAWYATVNALFGRFKKFKVDESILPVCTYISPCIARVGLTEKEAKEKNIPYHVIHFSLDELDRAITELDNHGFIKVLTVPNSDSIIGVCIVAKRADDMLSEFTLAMKYKLGLSKILRTPHPYPTWSEGNKHIAGLWQKSRIKPWTLNWLKKYHTWNRR